MGCLKAIVIALLAVSFARINPDNLFSQLYWAGQADSKDPGIQELAREAQDKLRNNYR